MFFVELINIEKNDVKTFEVLNSELKTIYTTKQIINHVLDGYLAFRPYSFEDPAKLTIIDFEGNYISSEDYNVGDRKMSNGLVFIDNNTAKDADQFINPNG